MKVLLYVGILLICFNNQLFSVQGEDELGGVAPPTEMVCGGVMVASPDASCCCPTEDYLCSATGECFIPLSTIPILLGFVAGLVLFGLLMGTLFRALLIRRHRNTAFGDVEEHSPGQEGVLFEGQVVPVAPLPEEVRSPSHPEQSHGVDLMVGTCSHCQQRFAYWNKVAAALNPSRFVKTVNCPHCRIPCRVNFDWFLLPLLYFFLVISLIFLSVVDVAMVQQAYNGHVSPLASLLIFFGLFAYSFPIFFTAKYYSYPQIIAPVPVPTL